MPSTTMPRTPRDVRLDFFRGLAMFIIFVVHVKGFNFWALYIPAAFGHSSAIEMFVFCSGFASAMAFGSVFQNQGFMIGSARVVFRMWQVYWAHIGLFLTIAVLCALGTTYLNTEDYIQRLNLTYFFENLDVALPALMTLRYVPNLFDILPMYIALLAAIPFVVAAYRLHPWAAFALVLAMHASAWIFDVNFSAHPQPPNGTPIYWFFNPFGWSLCFFAGFFFGRGWLKPPRLGDWRLLLICAAIVIVSLPLKQWYFNRISPEEILLLQPFLFLFTPEVKEVLFPDRWRSDHHWLRLVHFLALAYICLSFLEGRRHWLESVFVKPIVKVGQQALATFLLSLSLGWAAGMLMDVLAGGAGEPRDPWMVSAINIVCFAIMVATAYVVGWFKSQPWRRSSKPAGADNRPDRPEQPAAQPQKAMPQAAPAE